MQSAQIEKALTQQLVKNLPHHQVQEVYFYACLPGGKFFRPHLVWSILKDLNPEAYETSKEDINSNHALLASAVELHHTYTLLHDDLPCMDNDVLRRGKPCTHIAFNEWKALLAGDGLLNISYQLLSKLNHPEAFSLFRFFSWSLGPKGLIHGQVMDLSFEMTSSFESTLRTHELKTARLIQVSILGSALLSNPKRDYALDKKLWKYSRLLGINFQLIDDLSELSETNLSEHEKNVSPWIHFKKESYKQTIQGLKEFHALSKDLQLVHTSSIVKDYYNKMLGLIEPNQEVINAHLNGELDLNPVILLMKTFGDL